MARTAPVMSLAQEREQRQAITIAALAGEVNKEYGAGTLVRASDIIALPARLSTGSLWFDLALGGGWPVNGWSEIVGLESSGKTALAFNTIATAMARDPKFEALWCAAEPFDASYAEAIGVDLQRLWVLEENTMEIVYEKVTEAVEKRTVDMAVIDAYPSLVTDAEDEAFIGDAVVSPGARLTGRFMRLATKATKRSLIDPSDRPFTGLFINQWRDKVGVCFQYKTKVLLADGTWDWIGRIVNQRREVEVLSYDETTGKVVPQRVVGWHNNGDNPEKFLDIRVKPVVAINGRPTQMTVTRQHHVMTPRGWVEAQDLRPGSTVYQPTRRVLSNGHWALVRGALMGDGNLKRSGDGTASLRLGHGAKQQQYLEWKDRLLQIRKAADYTRQVDGSVHIDYCPLPELEEVRREIYETVPGKRYFGQSYVDQLTPLSIAIWYLDDAHLAKKSRGEFKKAGRVNISAKSMTPDSRDRLMYWLRENVHESVYWQQPGIFVFNKDATNALLTMVSQYAPSCMRYKLLDTFVPLGDRLTAFESLDDWELSLTEVVSVREAPVRKSNVRFDLTVENTHTYFAGGALVHNSFGDPRTTPGGKGKNFWFASRVEVSRADWLKDSQKFAIGQTMKLNVFKNKGAVPRREGMCDFYFDPGADGEHRLGEFDDAGGIAELALLLEVVTRGGRSSYKFGDTLLGTSKAEYIRAVRAEPAVQDMLRVAITRRELAGNEQVTTDPPPRRRFSRSRAA